MQLQTISAVEKYKIIHQKMIDQNDHSAEHLDLSVIDNAILKKQSNYIYLLYQIQKYNQSIETHQVGPVRKELYTSLYRILEDINLMNDKPNQLDHLKRTRAWFEDNIKTISNPRTSQFQYSKPRRNHVKSLYEKATSKQQDKSKIQTDQIVQQLLPFALKSRTLHTQYEPPVSKLNEYKRKIINILSPENIAQQLKPSRVLYPKPIMVAPQGFQGLDLSPQKMISTDQESPEKLDSNKDTLAEQSKIEESQIQHQQSQMEPQLGEEPEEEDSENEQEAEINKNQKQGIYSKAYKPEIIRNSNNIQLRGHFIHTQGDQTTAERIIEQKINKQANRELAKIKEDKECIQMAHHWSKTKSKAAKLLQAKLEQMKIDLNYQLIKDYTPSIDQLSEADDRKYFTQKKSKKHQKKFIDISSFELPKIKDAVVSGYEKTVEIQKLNKLKKKYSHILNLQQEPHEKRDVPKSVCQYSHRFKSFSEVLIDHSPEKQRLSQLDEVTAIKDRMTKHKMGPNVATLVHGLCTPQAQIKQLQSFPNAALFNNPFMIEKKKKKKK